MKGARARPMYRQKRTPPRTRPPMSHQRGFAATRVSSRASEDREADDVDASGAGARGDSAPHDGQEREAGEGDEEENRPVDVSEEASRQHADRGSALEGRAHEAHIGASTLGVADAGRQDHVRGCCGLVSQGLKRAGDDDASQRGRHEETEEGSGDDKPDAHVDDAAQRDEVPQGAVQEASHAEDDAGDRGDETGGIPRADVLGDAQVHQVEALEGDRSECVDCEEREEDTRGTVRERSVRGDAAHVDRGGRGLPPNHLRGHGGDAAGGTCRSR